VSSNSATGTVTSGLPTPLPIPRLPPGEVRRRQIAVAERLLGEDHRRRTRPAISRGRKKCRVCNLTCSSLAFYREHIQGRRHLAKVARVTDGVMQFFPQELSISQEIGLSKFLHQHFINGQTIVFIHENTLANYHRVLIYHPPLEWAFKAILSVVCMGYIGMPV
jgi:hypothetical protein